VKSWAATVDLIIGQAALPRTLGKIELVRVNQPAEGFRGEESADRVAGRGEAAVRIGAVGGRRGSAGEPTGNGSGLWE